MTTMMMNYTYTGTNGDTYTGQVVADTTIAKYNYTPGAVYKTPSGSYQMGSGPGIATKAPSGSVYQTTYKDGATGVAYDSYHYDPKNNAYYDVKTQPYDPTTGMYTPPGSTPVPMWSTTKGLGSEYAYAKSADNSYHIYGGGGTAHAMITPSALGLVAYDFRFTYPDGKTYYNGRVVDDGTYGYKAGMTIPQAGGGSYSIYAVDATKPDAKALAGETYTLLYHDSDGTNYPPGDVIPTSPYYNKPTGYGGLASETDYAQKNGSYYRFDNTSRADQSTPIPTIPLPT